MGREQGRGVGTALPGPHPQPRCQLGRSPQPLGTQNMSPPPRSWDCLGLVPPGPVVVWSHSPKHSDLCVEVPSLPPRTPSWELLSAQIQARSPAFRFSTSKLCVGGGPSTSVGGHPSTLYLWETFPAHTYSRKAPVGPWRRGCLAPGLTSPAVSSCHSSRAHCPCAPWWAHGPLPATAPALYQ